MRIISTIKETISDGPGLRYAIYFSGCNHSCNGCHNPKSWNPNLGKLVDREFLMEIIDEINANKMLNGITLSGGDPFFNPEDLLLFLKELKTRTKLNIWVYTGYTIEEIVKNQKASQCLKYIDVLVDGKFEITKRNLKLKFIGSSNQRIINIKKINDL